MSTHTNQKLILQVIEADMVNKRPASPFSLCLTISICHLFLSPLFPLSIPSGSWDI